MGPSAPLLVIRDAEMAPPDALEVSQMHKSASGGAQSASGGEPDAQIKVHLEVSQMHKSASGGAQSASAGEPDAQKCIWR